MCADLVLFDFDTINDTPSYDNPKQACEGILKVYVNGVLTAETADIPEHGQAKYLEEA